MRPEDQRDPDPGQRRGRGLQGDAAIGQQRDDVGQRAVDRDDVEEEGDRERPEQAGAERLARLDAGQRHRRYAVARARGDLRRLAQEQRDRHEGDHQDRDAQPEIGGAPAEGGDQRRRELRHERDAEPDPGDADAEGKAALPVEPLRHHRRIGDRRADAADHAGHGEEQIGHRERRGLDQRIGGGRGGIDEKARDHDAARAPAIDQPADRPGRTGPPEQRMQGQRRGEHRAADAELGGDRLQENAKRKDIDRAAADNQAADGREHDPPAIRKDAAHRRSLPFFWEDLAGRGWIRHGGSAR